MDGMRVALILVITLPGGTCSARCIILSSCLLLWLWFLGFALTRLTENIPKKENYQSFEIMIFSQSLTQLNICKHLPTSQVSVCMHVCQQGLTHLNAWMMTVPKTMKSAEKIKDRIGIISRLSGKKWSKKNEFGLKHTGKKIQCTA